LDDAAHFTAGWGDRLTGNLTKHIRDWLRDLIDLPRWEPRDPCDEGYLAGHLFGALHDYALTRGAGKAGGALRAARQQKRRVHSRYADGTPVYEDEVPQRLPPGPDPAAEGAHTRLRWDTINKRVYQGREFDAEGNPVRDIDFTTHPLASHPTPHQHEWIPNIPGNPRSGHRRSKNPKPL